MIKCLTLNTYSWALGPLGLWGAAPDRKHRAREAGRWLRSQEVDLVFLQEVCRPRDAALLWRGSGMPHAFFPRGGAGLGILSRHPLKQRRFQPFRWQGSGSGEGWRLAARMKNGVAAAWVEFPDGRELLASVTHLLARYHYVPGFADPADCLTPERQANLLELGTRLARWTAGGGPWILGGDFNMNQRSAEYAFFRRLHGVGDALKIQAERDSGEWAAMGTYTDENPFVRSQGNPSEGILDYVFFSEGAFSVVGAEISREPDAFSDHRAVRAHLNWTGQSPQPLRLPPLEPAERVSLDAYFSRVRVAWPGYLAPAGWTQRRDIRRFLSVI